MGLDDADGPGQWVRSQQRWSVRAWHGLKVSLLLETEDMEEHHMHSRGRYASVPAPASEAFLPHGLKRVALTEQGIVLLAEHYAEILSKIAKDDLADKGNSDGFAKLIACWKASWACAQCIACLW